MQLDFDRYSLIRAAGLACLSGSAELGFNGRLGPGDFLILHRERLQTNQNQEFRLLQLFARTGLSILVGRLKLFQGCGAY